MLGIFFSRPDHPLADPKEAKRVLEDLAGREPEGAIDEATALLESLAQIPGFKPDQRLALAVQLDDAMLVPVRRLGREYVAARMSRIQEKRMWKAGRDYWLALTSVYDNCLKRVDANEKGADAVKAQLGLLFARLIHAAGQRLKWEQYRYGPIDAELWRLTGRIYLAAAGQKMAGKKVAFYPGTGETSPEAEYLKVLVFQASSMDNLLPVEIELAEHLITHFLPHFVFTAEVRPDNVYWIDAALAGPPARLARAPERTPTLRFFNSIPAVEAVDAVRQNIAHSGRIPTEVNLGGQYPAETVIPVLEHLAMCWSPKPPMRSYTRHRVKSRLTVIHGVDELHRQLLGDRESADGETWVVDDVSQGGMGAKVPLGSGSAGDWVRIGTLIGLQPEGGGNWLAGMVRRFGRESETVGAVGIQTVSKAPRAFVADAGGLHTDGILLDAPAQGEAVRVALLPTAWEAGISLVFPLDGARVRLFPEEIVESGAEVVIARYRVQEFG